MQGTAKLDGVRSRLELRVYLLAGALLIVPVIALPAMAGSQVMPQKPYGSVNAAAFQSPLPLHAASPAAGNVEDGQALFTGRRKFQNGGPPCASCHSVATLPFPSGGTMAPDLTHEYSKLGPEGMHYALRTLYFPAMNALFLKRQLTDQEERDLAAFFQSADRVQRSRSQTGIFGGVAVLGLFVLVGITWMSGRGRLHSVRRKLLGRAGLYREMR